MEAVQTESAVQQRLQQWVAQFFLNLTLEGGNDEDLARIYAASQEEEWHLGRPLLDPDRNDTEFQPFIHYEAAKKTALEWNMPMTRQGLLVVLIGTKKIEHAQMVLAIIKWRFEGIKASMEDKVIDVGFVHDLLHGRTVADAYFEQMWAKQLVAKRETLEWGNVKFPEGYTTFPLMDMLVDYDFERG